MDHNDFEKRALRAIAKGAYLEESALDLNATFRDLGLESMDLLEIVFELEDEFNVNLPMDEHTDLSTIRGHELLALLKQIVESANNSTSQTEK